VVGLRWTGKKHEVEINRIGDQNTALLAEKEKRLTERDQRIAELKAEIEELKKKLTRSAQKDKGADGGTKP
jgi:molecular chaperone GrpE (heat shock protein)